MDEPTPKNKAIVVCATHGLHYNAELESGCVLCRRLKEPTTGSGSPFRHLPFLFALSLLGLAGFLGLRAKRLRDAAVLAAQAEGPPPIPSMMAEMEYTPPTPPVRPAPPQPLPRPSDPLEARAMGDDRDAALTSMYTAAERGSGRAIKRMLSEGANINELEERYKRLDSTPLSIAIASDQPWLALWLIREGADVKRGDLVTAAARKRMSSVVRALLDKGLDPNPPDRDKYRYDEKPIDYAVDNTDVATADVLARHGAQLNNIMKFGTTLLTRAARNRNENSVHIVQLLIDHGADPNKLDKQRDSDNYREDVGFTPLRQAALSGNADVVRLLILNGVSVNYTRNDGFRMQPLLAEAAITRNKPDNDTGQRDVIHTLIELGANPSAASSYMAACPRCNDYRPWAEEAFIKKSAERANFTSIYSVVDEGGNTHLHWAARLGETALIKRLLERDMDIDTVAHGPGRFSGKYAAGGTPLHLAAAYGHMPAVEVLLAAGAKRDRVDTQGKKPSDVACKHFPSNYQSEEAELCKRMKALLGGDAAR
ncbi:MAG TPA: ankyrin repeat domain-containing protein [Polyangiales bacterium]|nr:ankyrin repeat domain-containing protein [Polyangiales bacterium]